MSVEFDKVFKRYGAMEAVAGISFTVDSGTLVTLLGPSGCGKTTTLRGGAAQTLLYVILPLLRPAIVGALVYGFVRAVTTVSAVVFLVTAEYELATTYIILRVINGDYGLAIAYSCALIALMLAVILLIQFAVGGRRLGPRLAPALGGRA